jgi:hypothetical protein
MASAKHIAELALGGEDVEGLEEPELDLDEHGKALAMLHHKAIMSGDPERIWESHKALHSAATLALEHQSPDKDEFEPEYQGSDSDAYSASDE